MASIYLPPIARKKKVDGWPRQDTSRVFPDMEDDLKQDTSYKSEFIRHNVPPTPQRLVSANRKNKPQPKAVTFLRQNPRFVCEPICHVDTVVQRENETIHSWWPDETLQRPVKKPTYSLSSTSRADYGNFTLCNPHTGYSRHDNLSHSTSHLKSAVGLLPGYSSSGNANHVSEKISYEHQFNSRLDPSHPIRGKRHGCFVWKVVTPTRSKHYRDKSLSNRLNHVKDVSYELMNTDVNDDNIDAKSIVSTISDKTTKVKKIINRRDNLEPQVKNDAWSSSAVQSDNKIHRPVEIAKQQLETIKSEEPFEMTDQEMKEVIKPSKPRHHSPPPHII